MNKGELMKQIKGNLIVSCQALEGEPLYLGNTTIMPYMARAAKQAGACAIRTNGVMDVLAIKKEVHLPVIGLIKRSIPGFEPYITPTMKEIDQLVEAQADIIAFDCTMRERADGIKINDFIRAVKEKYPTMLFMADIATYEEGLNAYHAGMDLISTTLSGYTSYTLDRPIPDYDLVKKLSNDVAIPVIAEGRVHYPHEAKKMLEHGAFAVVVGGAITRPFEITKRFIQGMKG